MKEDRERESGALVAIVLLGWEVAAGLTKAAAGLFLKKSRPLSPAASPEERRRAQENEQRRAEAGAALLFGGVIGWRVGKSLLRRLGDWLLSESRGPRGPRGGASATTIEGGAFSPRRTPESRGTESNKPAAMGGGGSAPRGRDADRNLDAERGVNLSRRDRRGLALVALAFAASLAGGVGFLVTYWTGGGNLMLGGMLALSFGGLGVAAVVWARWLTVQKEAIDSREDPSSGEDHDQAASTFAAGAADIHRRRLLAGIAASGMALIGAMVISMFRSLGLSPDAALYTHVWKRGQRLMTVDGKPIAANALQPGGTTIVFPEDSIGSEKAQTVLVRVDPALLRLPRARASWAPMGNLAYSRVCTHAGCSVGMYEATSHQLMCPCHQSTFDVLRGAEPTSGPAARPLPQLPLYIDSEGNLRAAGGFTTPPGPGFWGMPA